MNFSSHLGRARGALGAALLISIALGCDEEGKTAPETCITTDFETYDIQDPPENPPDADNPCLTAIGHAVSPANEIGGSTSVGGTAGSGGTAGTSVDAGGAGGAPDTAQAGAGGA